MTVPKDRRFLKSHEWHKRDGDLVTIGISKFAADELTDITFVSLPAVGKQLTAGQSFGEVESVKATSDLYTGVSGVVTAVNKNLEDHPELVNNDSFGEGWMIQVKMSDPAQLDTLLSTDAYEQQLTG